MTKQDSASFTTVSQQLVIDIPEPSKGFPVSHHEWVSIKNKISFLREEDKTFFDAFGWKDFGMVFLGGALTILISFWLPPGYPSQNVKLIAEILMIFLAMVGIGCVCFQYQLDKKSRESNKTKAENIIDIMSLIEKNRSCLTDSQD